MELEKLIQQTNVPEIFKEVIMGETSFGIEIRSFYGIEELTYKYARYGGHYLGSANFSEIDETKKYHETPLESLLTIMETITGSNYNRNILGYGAVRDDIREIEKDHKNHNFTFYRLMGGVFGGTSLFLYGAICVDSQLQDLIIDNSNTTLLDVGFTNSFETTKNFLSMALGGALFAEVFRIPKMKSKSRGERWAFNQLIKDANQIDRKINDLLDREEDMGRLIEKLSAGSEVTRE